MNSISFHFNKPVRQQLTDLELEAFGERKSPPGQAVLYTFKLNSIYKLCGRLPQYAPAPYKLTFDL